MTQPGSVCALSFIYESHYQCNAEQNNSDVIAFISFSVLTEWKIPLANSNSHLESWNLNNN